MKLKRVFSEPLETNEGANGSLTEEKSSNEVIGQEENGDWYFKQAQINLQRRKYQDAMTAFEKAIELGCSNMGQAFEMRGTFNHLQGDSESATEDFSKAIELKPGYTRPYIKRASTYMERGNIKEAWREFDEAIKINPNDPDVHYHRGQVHFITNELEKAIKDYKRSIELDGKFVLGHIQLAIAQYKMGSIDDGIETFKEGLQKFDQSADMHNYYGELLLDLQRYDEALEQFERAIELEENNPLPYVNKALLAFQRQDPVQAEELCRKALEVEPDSDVANPAMSQILLQQGKVESSLKYIEKCVEVARTEAELIGHLQFAEAARSQLAFQRNYPEFAERLSFTPR